MDQSAQPVVEIRHLVKAYRRGGQPVPVLTDITFDIASGDPSRTGRNVGEDKKPGSGEEKEGARENHFDKNESTSKEGLSATASSR